MANYKRPNNTLIIISIILIIVSILLYILFDIVFLLLFIPIGALGLFRKR